MQARSVVITLDRYYIYRLDHERADIQQANDIIDQLMMPLYQSTNDYMFIMSIITGNSRISEKQVDVKRSD